MKFRSYKQLKGSWTKYGGARGGAIDVNQYGERCGKFYCQSCGKENPPEINGYKVEFEKKEYIKVCAVCYFSDFRKILNERLKKEENFLLNLAK